VSGYQEPRPELLENLDSNSGQGLRGSATEKTLINDFAVLSALRFPKSYIALVELIIPDVELV